MFEWECPECGELNGFWDFSCSNCDFNKEGFSPYDWELDKG